MFSNAPYPLFIARIRIKRTHVDPFVTPSVRATRWKRRNSAPAFFPPPKTNYSSLVIMGNAGQLRAAETRCTESERNGGGAAGKERRGRRGAGGACAHALPSLRIAPLPPPLFCSISTAFGIAFVCWSQSALRGITAPPRRTHYH